MIHRRRRRINQKKRNKLYQVCCYKSCYNFTQSLGNKDIYLLAVAMGLDNPTEQMIKPESWTRVVNFSEKDKALIISALLGTAGSTDEIEEYCDLNNAFSYCKKFTDAGFEEIDRIAADVKYNPELLVRKMLNYVDEIYDDVVGKLLDKDETI